MKKSKGALIIIFSAFISIIIMLYHSIYLSNSNHYVQEQLLKEKEANHDKTYIKSIETTNDNHVKTMNRNDEITVNNKDYLESDGLPEKQSTNDYKSKDKKNSGNLNEELPNEDMKKDDKTKELSGEVCLPTEPDSMESYNNYIKEKEQAVFKVSTGKIMESLTASDKIKLLYVSMHLGKEEYRKVEKYLYAEDAEDGVLKALKLLRADLSEKEYEKVRKIAGRFINMDIAEKLK